MQDEPLEPAVAPGTDLRRYARILARVHEATLSGDRPPVQPRSVIGDSWARVLRSRLDPDIGATDILFAAIDEVEHRRRASGLTDVMPLLRRQLSTIIGDPSQITIVTDAEGYLLWREGSNGIRHLADGVGFMEGARWTETDVGSNGIGICLVDRRPVQIYTAEHYVRAQHPWTCSAAPIHDPRDGGLLGVVNVTGPAATAHPNLLALVDTVAKLAEARIQAVHRDELDQLRAVGVPLLGRIGGPALVVDPNGWVAAVAELAPVKRVPIPGRIGQQRAWIPSLGQCQIDAVPGGWLLRPAGEEASPATRIVLDLRRGTRWSVTVSSAAGSWEQSLSRRHAEILFILAMHPAGRSAAELSDDLFDDPTRTVTVRAEMSRLRRHLGGVLEPRPYRFGGWIDVAVQRPVHDADLLPGSTAPAVRRLRRPSPE